jgi:hypothetical protein
VSKPLFSSNGANIAAQVQASLFEGQPDDFELVSQDAAGNSVESEPEPDPEADQSAEDMLDDFNWVGSRHHY